jgi:two-component system nitrate/nitrite sensor histidine kinase NarX
MLATIISASDATAGIVRVFSPDGMVLRTIACSGLPAEICQSEDLVEAGCGVCGMSAAYAIGFSDSGFCSSHNGAEFFGESCRYVLALPLRGVENGDGPAGVVTLFFSTEINIGDAMKRMLQTYAELLHIALKNVWRIEDGHQLALLAERQSIANEIHDSLAQTLYFAKIRSSLLVDAMKSDDDLLAYKCAQDIEEALDGGQMTVRELVTHFRSQLDPQGLQFALQKLVKDFTGRSGIALEYGNELGEINLPPEYELQIFLIVRESLVNVAKHSGATIASLAATSDGNKYQFVIEDNGSGIASVASGEGHYGLAIMRERALRIGGEVKIENLQGLGTRVRLIFGAPVA